MTNQTLGHYIPVTGNHDTNNNDGSFRSYFLQIPGTFEHFQAHSLSFEMFHFRILRCDGRGEESAVIVDCTNSNLITTYSRREQGGNRKTWRVGWRMAGGRHDQDNWITTGSNQILRPNFIPLIVAIFEEQSPPDRADISSVLIWCLLAVILGRICLIVTTKNKSISATMFPV